MAIVRFNGSVQDTPQTSSFTPSLTWAADDTARITIGDSYVEITLGNSIAEADIVRSLEKAINANDKTTNLHADETRNIGGQSRGEFRDVKASSASNTLTLTSVVDGVDFVATATETTAGDGVMGSATTVAATGGEWFNNVGNWDGGAAPGSGDIALFSDLRDKHIRRGLDTIANFDGVTRLGTFAGDVGLPAINKTHRGFWYPEYRTRFLKVDKSTDGAVINLGDGTGTSRGLNKFNNYRHDCTYYINDTAVQDKDGINPIEIISDPGGTGGGVVVHNIMGDTDIGMRNGDSTATPGTGCEVEEIYVSEGDSKVRIECQVEAASDLRIYGGVVETHNALTSFTTLVLEGGTLVHYAGDIPGLTIGSNAKLDYRSPDDPTGDLIVKGGGELTFDNNRAAKVMTNIDIRLNDGAKFSDVHGVAVPSGTGEYFFLNSSTSKDIILPRSYSFAPTIISGGG